MAQGHTATEKQGQDLKPGSLVPEPTPSCTPNTAGKLSPMDTWEADEVRKTERVHASQEKKKLDSQNLYSNLVCDNQQRKGCQPSPSLGSASVPEKSTQE